MTVGINRTIVIACLALMRVADVAPRHVIQGQRSRTIIGALDGHPRSLQVPLRDGVAVEHALLKISNSVSVPIGLERVKDQPLPDRMSRVVRGTHAENITGRTLADVMDLLFRSVAHYDGEPGAAFAWSERAGIIHISNSQSTTFLETPVMTFTASGVTLRDVLQRIHALVDPDFPSPREIGSAGSVGTADKSGDELSRSMKTLNKKFSFHMEGGTIRDLLDQAIIAHGEVSWIVRYNDQSGGHARSELAFSTFDGFDIALPARREQ